MITDVKQSGHLYGRLHVAAARACGHLLSWLYLQLGSRGRSPKGGPCGCTSSSLRLRVQGQMSIPMAGMQPRGPTAR